MEVGKNAENHLTSPAAFVDGGIQDPCEDTCSICLEEFCESDPSSVMSCVLIYMYYSWLDSGGNMSN